MDCLDYRGPGVCLWIMTKTISIIAKMKMKTPAATDAAGAPDDPTVQYKAVTKIHRIVKPKKMNRKTTLGFPSASKGRMRRE